MPQSPSTPLEEIPIVHGVLTRSFLTGKSRPLAYRRAQLVRLALLIQENYEAFQKTLASDLGKPALEATMGELALLVDRAIYAINNLEAWSAPAKPEVLPMFAPLNPTILKQPRGVVLIIGPYNYPLLLVLQPLIGAIASGCAAVVKPSELTIHTATLLAQLLPKYLDQDLYRVVNGNAAQATKLLELKWSYIFYTGGKATARIVAAAAAKHFTLITLELGGKSPVIVDGACDIELSARRILFGKIQNAGQVRVAPDYVIVPRAKQEDLIAAFTKTLQEFFPNGSRNSPDFARIINDRHFNRLSDLLKRTSGRIILGGHSDLSTRYMELTVVADVKEGDSLLEEIFGPILPVVVLDSVEEAIRFVNDRPSPLAFYVFTSDEVFKQKVIDQTASGCVILNDTYWQLAVTELPLCGVGDSGYGAQVGKYTFDGFTHNRATLDNPEETEPYLGVRYPPYVPEKYEVMSRGLFQKIPRVEGTDILYPSTLTE